jgi:hypothetical protein
MRTPEPQNVSFAELIDFLEYCEYIEYQPDFVCADYANAMQKGAEWEMIRVATVVAPIEYENYTGLHAFNAFETTDCGMVYVDPWRGCFWTRYDIRNLYDTRGCENVVGQRGEWFVGGIMFYPLGFRTPDWVFANYWEALRCEENYLINWCLSGEWEPVKYASSK